MSISRRKFVQDSAAFASLATVSPLLHGTPKAKSSSGNQPLYIIVQGPWLFNVVGTPGSAPTAIYATTKQAPAGEHHYEYLNPRAPGASPNEIPVIGALPLGGSVTVTVNRTGRGGAKPFSKMYGAQQGLFFDSSIELPKAPIPDGFYISLPNPDAIFALGLISGVDFKYGQNILKQTVNSWPSALAFQYTQWDDATVSGYVAGQGSTPEGPLQPGARPVVRLFRIARRDDMDVCHERVHAEEYFGSVMKLPKISSDKDRPSVKFKQATGGPSAPSPVSVAYPMPPDLQCSDLGDAPGCSRSDQEKTMISVSLVNCASGGGGTGGSGCC